MKHSDNLDMIGRLTGLLNVALTETNNHEISHLQLKPCVTKLYLNYHITFSLMSSLSLQGCCNKNTDYPSDDGQNLFLTAILIHSGSIVIVLFFSLWSFGKFVFC